MGTTDTTATSSTGTTSGTRSTPTARHNDIGLAKMATLVKEMRAERGAGDVPAARRRRHHPGHAAGLLLRQGRPDHRRREAPDGHGDERHRLRRRGARQPRVQLRPRTLRAFEEQLDFPLLERQLARLGHRRARLPAVRHPKLQGARARPGRSRSASSAWSPPASRSGTRPTSRAGCASTASSSRARCGCQAQAGRLRRRHRVVPLRCRHRARPTVTRCRSRERRHAAGPAGARASTRSWSGHAHEEIPERFVDEHRRPASRCCSPSRSSGACGWP